MQLPEKDIDFFQKRLQGERDSFIEIYNKYWYRLFLACYRRTRNKEVAEELVQDLFLKLLQKQDALKIEQIEHYLFSSIRNATIDYLKRQMVADKYRSYQAIYASANCNSTEEMVGLQDLRYHLEEGLQRLPKKAGEIFRLNKIHHWPVEKIAQHLRLSKKTVHYHITRSQKFIRIFLKEFTLIVILFLLP